MSEQPPGDRPVIKWLWLLVVMLIAGAAIPAQGRVNAELAAAADDPLISTLFTYLVGMVIIAPVVFLTRRGRRGLANVRPAIREGSVSWWHLFAGCLGTYFIFTQGVAMAAVGVAVFSVAVVTGQTVGGLLWDKIGLGSGGPKHLNGFRLLGAGLTILSVLWAVSPQLSANGSLAWALMVVLPFTGGFVQSAQQAINGRQTAAYGTLLPATLFNFVTGAVLMALIYGGKVLIAGTGDALPAVWWNYLGGALGLVFVGLGAYLITQVGVLVTAMGMIAGQLVGSLVLDIVFPAPGSVIAFATVSGTFLTLVAVIVASLPDIRRSRPS
ncbi:DMT family transporter [Nesterenkonia populi]|uniref:DMT family transporter n=1 Tax=Nesterenkonia populi TaxID=1591087 RepID=UPI0011BFCBA5|nr:DMT family transporter [Nesterenkonia populi]